MPSTLYDWFPCPERLQRTLRVDDKDTSPEFPITTEQVKWVAIIGAGSGGLAALKTFVHDIPDDQRWEIELFEQRSGLGGVWSVQRRDHPWLNTNRRVHQYRLQHDSLARYPRLPKTPLYPQLRTNTPAPTSNHKSLHLLMPLADY